MRYWWVNQNKTYRHEVPENFLWSTKRNADGRPNPFYDFMREVAPGDVVFSFADTWIKAIGRVVSHGYEAPKPLEFGKVGAQWDTIGWRLDVVFAELQGVYLTALPVPLAAMLIELIGREAIHIVEAHIWDPPRISHPPP